MDERTFWGWAGGTLGASVKIIEGLAEESRPIHPEQLDTLRGLAERLVEAIAVAEKRQSDIE